MKLSICSLPELVIFSWRSSFSAAPTSHYVSHMFNSQCFVGTCTEVRRPPSICCVVRLLPGILQRWRGQHTLGKRCTLIIAPPCHTLPCIVQHSCGLEEHR